MFTRIFVALAWLYWRINRPFLAAFTETLLGYGEGDFVVDGRQIVQRVDHFLHEVTTTVFLEFVGTIALLPLYPPPSLPKSNLKRALVKFWYGVKSLVGHAHFLASTPSERTRWVDTMFKRLIDEAPVQADDRIKTIVTLTMLKTTLGMAYLDDERVWRALEYRPFTTRAFDPPSGPDLEHPPRTEGATLLHTMQKSPRQVAARPSNSFTYCVIGSGAGGAVAARTLQERDPRARIVMLESGPLVTNDQFVPHVLDSTARLFMNATATLSEDLQFEFLQGHCVGGSTTVNNSVAFKPEGFWWDDLRARWRALGVELDYDDLHAQYDVLSPMLNVNAVDDRVITTGARTIKAGFEALGQRVSEVPSGFRNCIGCGRCNIGCQYDAKQSALVAFLPDFVRDGGLLVPDAHVEGLDIETSGAGGRSRVRAVVVTDVNGERHRIEADRFVLSAGAYASSKLLWRSGFLGAQPGVRTVGKRLSVNAGSPIIGFFPDRQNSFLGLQIGYAIEMPEDRMIIETAFVPPGASSIGLTSWGAEFQRRLKRVNDAMFCVPVVASLAYGEVKRSLIGESGFAIDFTLSDEDWRRFEKGMKVTARAMFAAGATEVFIARFDARTITSVDQIDDYFAGIGASDFITVQAAHIQGGNVIAPEPRRGVVDANLKVHGMDNLWICDASVIPSPITLNIALTVMALSRYGAMRIPVAA
jgi:choline dehydrogenase-like flavoprotein